MIPQSSKLFHQAGQFYENPQIGCGHRQKFAAIGIRNKETLV
jgi:hypothetical protein